MEQSNYHFSFKIEVNNTKQKVWETLIDVQNWHQWDTELIEASLDGAFKKGAKGTLIRKKGPKLKFYISEISENNSYTLNTIMPVGELIIKRNLTINKSKICFTDDIQFTGFLKYFFGFMLGAQFKKILPEVMNKFKTLAESK